MHFSKRVLWLIARQAFGWNLVALGIAGLVLPILPGWLLIGWGAITLAPDFPFLRRLIHQVERKFPRLKAVIHKLRGHRHGQEPFSAGADGPG
ncbi:MAG TPA: PGPGW domain-containing protein [Pirellulales bacterium]|nr:PGPGW domain-containing protein [Pirellulales bacterium]